MLTTRNPAHTSSGITVFIHRHIWLLDILGMTASFAAVTWAFSPAAQAGGNGLRFTVLTAGILGEVIFLWRLMWLLLAALSHAVRLPSCARPILVATVEAWGTGSARRSLQRTAAIGAVGGALVAGGGVASAADVNSGDYLWPETSQTQNQQVRDIQARESLSESSAVIPSLLDDASPQTTGATQLPSLALPGSLDAANTHGATTSPSAYAEQSVVSSVLQADALHPGIQASDSRSQQTTMRRTDAAPGSSPADSAQMAPSPVYGRHERSQATSASRGPQTAGTSVGLPAMTAPPPSTETPVSDTYIVAAGDCLWTIAESLAPADAEDADIAALWQDIYRQNAEVIGTNPDHIEPGMELQLTAVA